MHHHLDRIVRRQEAQRSTFVPTKNLVGAHVGCGGDVFYVCPHSTMAYRHCTKCLASSLRGANLDVEK